MRIILSTDRSISTSDLYTKLSWFPFDYHVQYQTALLTYKALINEAPSYINDFLTTSTNFSLRSLANVNIQFPLVHKELFRNSITYSATTIWNNLPHYIKCSSSLSNYEHEMKVFCYASYHCRIL